MKKSLIFASIACAGAFALHADWSYSDWFTGIGAGATATNNLDQSANVSWSFANVTNGTVDFESGALVFDLETDESLSFSVTQSSAPDTNTVTAVEVSGLFSPVKTADLPTKAVMNTRLAQVGFVVGINDTPATNYYAWTGGDSWVALSGTPSDGETDLLVTFDYSNTNNLKVSFATISGTTTNTLQYSGNDWISLTSTAATNRYVAGVSCYGSGLISAANGAVGLGYAMMDDVKYGSIAEAVAAADGSSEETITVLRDTAEAVNVGTKDVKIVTTDGANYSGDVVVPSGGTYVLETVSSQYTEQGAGASGTYIFTKPDNVTVENGGKIGIALPSGISDHKEVASTNVSGNIITAVLQTKTSILEEMSPGGADLAVTDGLRTWLGNYASTAYNAADVTAASMESALEATGANDKALWLSYVVGADPTVADSLSPVTTPAGDKSTTAVTLALPKLGSPSGDYNVSYRVYKKVNEAWNAVGSDVSTPSAIPLPVGTETYKVSVILTEKVTP